MIIEDDIKLDYSDVLIRPKRSALTSRFDVEMERTYTFYHSQKEWIGVPVMASNMDTTGTFGMHEALSKQKMVLDTLTISKEDAIKINISTPVYVKNETKKIYQELLKS